MRIIVAGAGIGGLVTAMKLHSRGHDVVIYESVRELAPLGVGINILPHAMAVLDTLGMVEPLLGLGVATEELAFFNRHGQLIWREPRGRHAGYPVPQISIHRGRLQLALFEEAKRVLGDDAIVLGHAITGFEQSPGTVTVELLDRQNDRTVTDTAELLVGADGIHSTVRRHFVPDEGPPQWSGNMLWRATSQHEPYLTGRSMFMAGHRPHKFVAYPITEPEIGLQTINWIAELDWTAHGMPARESWNRVVERSLFDAEFSDWVFDWLDIPELIAGADTVLEFPMVDRDPLERWTHDRVTLLGDAAHPMYPIGSNGASQAILDAQALADALSEEVAPGGGGVDVALERYDVERRTATGAIVLANRGHGPEVVMDWAEERAPEGFDSVSDVFAEGELEAVSDRYKRVAGFVRPT
ncbi:MAG: flavin-dependent oxidoreductase [Acidimicrobiales bacterium]